MTQIPEIFDRALLRARRQRVAGEATNGDFLHDRIGRELAERVADISRQFEVAVDLGTHTGKLAMALENAPNVGHVITSDGCRNYLKNKSGLNVVADEEWLPFRAGCLDLIASNLQLQWANDLPGVFAQANQALKPDGLFMASMFGAGTLPELQASLLDAELDITGGASPRIVPLPDVREIGALLQRAGFALPVVDKDIIKVRYASPFDLMRDLRLMGVTNVATERSRKFLRRDVLLKAMEIYMERFAEPDGRIPATFSIIYLSGWHPHESQQKPLAPGSAKTRLADALKGQDGLKSNQ
ncbi:MAG: methyltransferase domain-containing protein [Rhizobiales bacterium]|nr:methyltransferase domain-containing protein [Hyphomicrobiales bacterium]